MTTIENSGPPAAVADSASWRPRRASLLSHAVAREAPLIITCACVAALWLGYPSIQIAADTWLNLLGGQLILAHGFPHHDNLAVLSHGRAWVDQQWLANVFFYALYKLGGLTMVAKANVLIFVSALAAAFAVARRRGATIPSVMLCCIPACLVSLDFARAQVLVQPLLVALLALLAAESRRRSWRVILVFPLLALWANLHGSVLIAAALTSLLGGVELYEKRRRNVGGLPRPLALIVLPWLCVFASPYGLALRTYYGATVGNPEFARHLTEWKPPTFPSLWGVPFFTFAALAIVLVARHRRSLTLFEICALALTALSGLMAVRSIPWFAFAGAIWLPSLLDRELNREKSASRPQLLSRPLALGGVAVSLLVVVISLARPGTPPAADWPPSGAAAVSTALAHDPAARVFASYDLADWLLFEAPAARGRVAYDGRWEILAPGTFDAVIRYLGQQTPQWESVSSGYRFLVLNPVNQAGLVNTYLGRANVKVVYRSRRVIVLDRGPAEDRSPRSG